ncbi:hypothetical protein GCM10027048_16380 [Hymenobacter coalescens]
MNKLLLALLICFGLAAATMPPASRAGEASVLSLADFKPLLSYDWLGTLRYRDYQSERTVTLQARLNGMRAGAQELVLDYQYQEPEGGLVKGFDRLRFPPGGTAIEWEGLLLQLRRRQTLPDGTLYLVLEGEGPDDNRPALIRRTVQIGSRFCRLRKQVRFAGDTAFVWRSEYSFRR